MQAPQEFQGDGRMFEAYCKKNGLCLLCGKTKVKKRGVFKLKKKKNQWQPLTERSKDSGDYIVYKGYCIQPGCFTLNQAKILLGEVAPSRLIKESRPDQTGKGKESLAHESSCKKEPKRVSRLLKGWNNECIVPLSGSNNPSNSVFSNEFTGFSARSRSNSYYVGQKSAKGKDERSSDQSGKLLSSVIRRDDDDVSVGSAMTSGSKVRASLKQLLEDNVGTVLDLSLTRLHHVHISELVQSLKVASSLETLILENCKLNDNEIEILANGLASNEGKATMLSRLSFRSNRIGNRGAVSLRPFFTATSSLEELDLSKNQIGSRGANYTFHAFRDNPRVKIKMLNLAHNEIWDVDGDGSFFSTNNTLQLLNLEGNYIHDEGIEPIFNGLYKSGGDTQLEELDLGWNGICDEGCIQIGQLLQTNSSLVKIGLGENDITSVGAKALLAALRSNDTLREISGLSHNQIDCSFIINTIKLLLSARIDTFVSEEDVQFRLEQMMESSLNGTYAPGQSEGIHLPTPEEMSESSLDWADKLYAPGEDARPPVAEIHALGVPLGETTALVNTTKLEIPDPASVDRDIPSTDDHRKNSNDLSSSLKFPIDRLSVIQAAPLVSLDQISNLHNPVPLRDCDHEKHVIEHAVEGASKLNATIEVDVVTGTVENFRSFFQAGTGRVLHFSGFGHQKQSFALENNSGMMDDSIDFESLKELVQSSKSPIQLVVVNSFYSGRIGKAFVDAGVPHVICCHHTEIFRDKACYSFLKNLYRGLALTKTIKEAFHDSQEAVRVEEITKHIERYVLLPRRPEADSYHDVPIFYTSPVPPTGMVLDVGKGTFDIDKPLIPEIPQHFIGRELDMYHILEALRMDNLVRVGGIKGMGKSAAMAAVCQYINHRKTFFSFDSVLCLPPGKGIIPSPDTLFGDLSFFFAEMTKPNLDILANEFHMEIKERIMLELQEQATFLAIDCRKFPDETLTNLELFIEELLQSNINVKIILISEDMTEDESDENVILGPIDFKSTALLFGEISRFITANGCPAAQSPDEFASLMVPPSVILSGDKSNSASSRQSRLISQIGNGIPMEILRAGKIMPASVFIHLIGMANTPEIFVDSHSSLDAAMRKWSQCLEKAVTNKNFLRAMDLEHTMRELHRFKAQFPSIDELLAQEKELHRRHTACFKNRHYEEGNRLKREIIALKKRILQEKRSATSASTRKNVTADGMNDLQEQVDSIMKLANSSFSSEMELPYPEKSEAVFILGSGYHNCALHIYSGQVCDFDPQNNDLGAVVCWTNECCDLSSDTHGQMFIEYGGTRLSKDITSLPGITKTPWGVAKCGTGNAVIVGPGSYGSLKVCCVVLAVGPMSVAGVDRIKAEDKDELHYIKVMMRSCIRSSMILAKHSQVQSVAFPTLSPDEACTSYDHLLMMQLKLLVEEANHSDLISLHIVAKSEVEASKLVGMAQELGLSAMDTGPNQ